MVKYFHKDSRGSTVLPSVVAEGFTETVAGDLGWEFCCFSCCANYAVGLRAGDCAACDGVGE